MHFDLSEPEDSEVTAQTASGTDEGSNEDIAADAEVKDPEQQQQEASKTPMEEPQLSNSNRLKAKMQCCSWVMTKSQMTRSLHTAFTHQYNLRAWIMR
ncbi:hypothetical protein CLOP_g19936 [Closterium sp. NIES-67]|nr:hypothetical protein CLOP_g19936 [Closterium sp. NIES-67]